MASNNTSLGVGTDDTHGKNNTAIGAYSGYSCTGDDDFNNTTVGTNTLYYSATCNNNTAIGAGSMCNSTSGNLNTSVGSSALEGELNQSVGNANVAIGAQALYVNTGNLNTAIGTYAALDVTQGSYNTFLGANTTFDISTNQYQYSTAIGYNAVIDASNQVMIGGTGPSGYPNVVIPGKAYLPNFNVLDVSANQIVTKQYVDYVAQGLSPKAACQCIATAGVIISPGTINVANSFTTLFTIDGYTIQPGDRVLINNQGSPDTSANVLNGIYIVTGSTAPYTWARSADMANNSDALGAFCFIENGAEYQSTSWVQSTTYGQGQPIVVGTDALLFVKYSSFYYNIGRGLDTFINNNKTYIQVDLSLNAINYLDSNPNAVQPGTAPSGSGTLNIGTSGTNKTIIGPASGNPVQFPSGITGATGSFTYLTTSYDANLNGINVGRGPGSNSENTLVGNSALNSNSSGIQNTAVGFVSLNQNTSGSFNTALGNYSLFNTNGGNSNTSVGSTCLASNISGSNNTSVGAASLQGFNSNNDTALGFLAGIYDINGSNNTYLGYSTGQLSGDTNTYVYSTAVGSNAVINSSNQIMLGGLNNGNYPLVNAPGGITGTTGSFTYLSASQTLSAPGGITGATGSFNYLSSSQILSAPGGITGATGSFTYLSSSQTLSAPGGITGATGSFTYLSSSQTLSAPGGITGATGSFNYLSSSQTLSAPGGITGATGSFNYLSSSQILSAPGGITGATGSFTYLSSSQTLSAPGGITGATGSFTYLSSSQKLSAAGGITGPTGSFTYLNVSGNTNIGSTLTVNNNAGLTGQYLISNGPNTAPTWQTTPLLQQGINGAPSSFTYLSASQDITGATGSFTYLSASQGITGATGSLQYLTIGNIDNISSNNYTANFIQTSYNGNWSSVSISSSGQYQIAIDISAGIAISSNYGASWVYPTIPNTPNNPNWSSSAISASGQYQTVVGNGIIYYSSNYGVTWNQSSAPSRNWSSNKCLAMNALGQYQTAVEQNGTWYSTDYGVTWTQNQSFSQNPYNYFNSVAVSSTGQYQTAISANDYGFIWNSFDYGITWSQNQNTPRSAFGWLTVAVSASGQYQTVVSNGSIIYTSTDYGVTWNSVNIGGVANAMSASGQYQIVVSNGILYYSTDYGVTWTQQNSYYGNYSANFSSVAISASGKYQTIVAINYTYYGLTNGRIFTYTAPNATSLNVITNANITGNLNIDGNMRTTNTIYASGGITGATGSFNYLYVTQGITGPAGSLTSLKTFVIDHPVESEKYLVHACLEGPEAGVYYRGEAKIENNHSTTVFLPEYVNKLATNFTIHLTPIYEELDEEPSPIPLKCSRVKDNKFNVYGQNGSFYWTVYGKRQDIEIEPLKAAAKVEGNGPYKWIQP